LASLCALASVLAAHGARADAPALPLVRLLAKAPLLGPGAPSTAARHPLADAAGRVPLLVELPAGADAAALGLLSVGPGIGAIRLEPSALDAFAAAHPELRLLAGPPRHTLLDKSKLWTRSAEYRAASGQDGKGVVVGIVDTGLDVSHPDFRDAKGKTRVAWMLASGAPQGLHAELEAKYGCSLPNQSSCVVLDGEDIDALLASGSRLGLPRDAEGHGTHVLSIAAGNGGPSATSRPRYVGMAPGATLIVAAPGEAGGFYDADILNAAKFVFERADALGMPAVVNISIGGDFGPHDGTSLLEKGLAALVGDAHPGRAIVVAAGNSGGLYRTATGGPFGIHTEAHVFPDAEVRVPLIAPPATKGQGFIWITFDPADHVSVALEGPGGARWIDFVDPGDQKGYKGDDGTTGAVVNRVADGTTQITPDTNSAVVAWDGAWPEGEFAVLLRGTGNAQLWITGMGDAAPGGQTAVLFERAIKQGTINVPASHPNLIAAGCTINRVAWSSYKNDQISISELGADRPPVEDGDCYFSAAGPTPAGVPKPDISAPGAFVAAAMSVDADPRKHRGGLFDPPGCPTGDPCYLVDGAHAIAIGTSMSSPHVAGAVALLLERDPTLTQARILDLIQAGARYPTGSVPYDYQLGPGELDIVATIAALDAEATMPREPDLAKSWYTLSSAYARPDGKWPVWGTIELRRDDGSTASGLDASRFAIALDGGVLLTPPTRVRHGLYRFAFAGTPGTGGGQLRVEVLYDGATLGARTLPVGMDVWSTHGGVDALGGGCSCAVAGAPSKRAPAAVLAALGAAALWIARGRRPARRAGRG
jgi:MYXO-CTERM domain-containing protein